MSFIEAFVCQIILAAMVSSEGLGDLAKMLSLLGGQDDCKFRCPKGVDPIVNSRHVPSSNGCGSMGLKLDTSDLPGFTECCDDHDKCYDTCNKDRNVCDEDFNSCLSNVCLLEGLSNKKSKKEMDKCQQSADLMYSGTVGFGCAAFKESQRSACLCNGRTISSKEFRDMEMKKAEL